LCVLEPRLDLVHLHSWRFDAFFRFLLKRVQDVDHSFELDGVDGPKGVAIEVRNDLKRSGALESF
jgi:hypothetical protein